MHESPSTVIAVNGLSKEKAGDVVLSHTISRAVPSAQRGLTTVFGMGTGVTLAVKPPTNMKRVWIVSFIVPPSLKRYGESCVRKSL
jgi:hypothetical protein